MNAQKTQEDNIYVIYARFINSSASHHETMSDSISSEPSRVSLSKRLRFGSVEIIALPMELGNHPPSQGAPVTVGWEPIDTRKTTVDLYEIFREGSRRGKNNLKLELFERAVILLRAGYSIDEIGEATEAAHETMKLRAESSQTQKWEYFQLTASKAGRKIKKIVTLRRRAAPAAA
jgi:hypothetical protein